MFINKPVDNNQTLYVHIHTIRDGHPPRRRFPTSESEVGDGRQGGKKSRQSGKIPAPPAVNYLVTQEVVYLTPVQDSTAESLGRNFVIIVSSASIRVVVSQFRVNLRNQQ
eukprot:TRINITY_DN99_c1_g1_i5.p5 TRINITY_DN99_c1_g1~~TRINITY_DN99_c1_g1_i5.p5  ORF type:complete len:110 (+),score=5.86 TRINITY_DN99_c1_g1_i5:835-1164(+)